MYDDRLGRRIIKADADTDTLASLSLTHHGLSIHQTTINQPTQINPNHNDTKSTPLFSLTRQSAVAVEGQLRLALRPVVPHNVVALLQPGDLLFEPVKEN